MTNQASESNVSQNTSTASRGCGPRGCGPRGGAGPFGPMAWRRVPVNIEETPQAYVLSLYAAGLDKSGLRVSAQDDVLQLRYQAPKSEAEGGRKFTRREQAAQDFEREFALNGRVQLDAITARYSEGVLTVLLPKTASAQQAEQQIPVQ